MSSELVARAVLHRIADAQPEITLEDGAAVVTESVAIRAMEDFAERAFSDVETLRARLEALEAENAQLRKKLSGCQWYWPEDDTSSEACAEAAERLAGARVKALEWNEDWSGELDDIPVWFAMTPWGRISVFFAGHDYKQHSDVPAYELREKLAAAQADYERRILSAIAEPAGEAGPKPAAWMDRTGRDLHPIIKDYQKQNMIAAGGVQRKRAGNYSIALYTTPPASAIRDELDIDSLLQPLDDIYVRDGFCDWADVANARDEIRAALAGAKP